MEKTMTEKVVKVAAVAPIVFSKNSTDSASTIVQIGELNYNASISMHYLGDGKYTEHVEIAGLDVAMLKKFGTTFDYSEVITKYKEQKDIIQQTRKAAEEAKRLAVWESNEALAKQIGMQLNGSKEAFLEGSWWGLSFKHEEVYKGVKIEITLRDGYGVMKEMSNNVYSYDSAYRTKKMKKLEKAAECLVEMICNCKSKIDNDQAAAKETAKKNATVQEVLSGETITVEKEYHSSGYGRRSRGYTEEQFQITADKKEGQSDWDRSRVRFTYDTSKKVFRIKELTASLTAEQMKQIVAIVKA